MCSIVHAVTSYRTWRCSHSPHIASCTRYLSLSCLHLFYMLLYYFLCTERKKASLTAFMFYVCEKGREREKREAHRACLRAFIFLGHPPLCAVYCCMPADCTRPAPASLACICCCCARRVCLAFLFPPPLLIHSSPAHLHLITSLCKKPQASISCCSTCMPGLIVPSGSSFLYALYHLCAVGNFGKWLSTSFLII